MDHMVCHTCVYFIVDDTVQDGEWLVDHLTNDAQQHVPWQHVRC